MKKGEALREHYESWHITIGSLKKIGVKHKINDTNITLSIHEDNDVNIYFRLSGIRVYVVPQLKSRILCMDNGLYSLDLRNRGKEDKYLEETYFVDNSCIDNFLFNLCNPKTSIVRISDNIEFNTTYEIINYYMNKELKSWQRGTYPIVNNYIRFWFPKFAKKKDGKLISQSNTKNWINVKSSDNDEILMYSDTETSKKRANFSVVFGKENNENYKFVGVYAIEEYAPNRCLFKKISDSFNFSNNEIELFKDDISEDIYLNAVNDEKLKQIAKKNQKEKPKKIDNSSTTYVRDKSIAEYAKRKANGICQLCGNPAPFISKNGMPYLESHHIIWLSQGGGDTIENTVALCPNCHRKMHEVADKNDIAILKERNKEA